jgi:squalene-associated FAD-dependent desaturase
MSTVHIIGGGLAGLSACVALAQAGRMVALYEAGPNAGGRCRSYFDRELGCRIDNGNHLILSGNRATMAYLAAIDARGTMRDPGEARFPFVDLSDGARWTLAPGSGRIPWWVMQPSRRVPDTKARDYLRILALRKAGLNATVAELLDRPGALYTKLLEPLAVAVLNTPPTEAMARLLGAVVEETLLAGGAACIPLFPRTDLSVSLIDPAIAFLRGHGGAVHLSCLVSALGTVAGRVTTLTTTAGPIALGANDQVVLAVPPWIATTMLPDLVVPDAFQAILNVHFRLHADLGNLGFIGVIGGMAEWVFTKPDVVSVTISAANRYVDLPASEIAARVWPDVQKVLELDLPMPPVRVVKERRATFAATAAQEARRPGPRTALANMVLAGDWTATGLPATIEGAIRSGDTAAKLVLG